MKGRFLRQEEAMRHPVTEASYDSVVACVGWEGVEVLQSCWPASSFKHTLGSQVFWTHPRLCCDAHMRRVSVATCITPRLTSAPGLVIF